MENNSGNDLEISGYTYNVLIRLCPSILTVIPQDNNINGYIQVLRESIWKTTQLFLWQDTEAKIWSV